MQIFSHNEGTLSISVIRIPAHHHTTSGHSHTPRGVEADITMWSYCKHCSRVVTPLVVMDEDTWKLSFAKFLEVSV